MLTVGAYERDNVADLLFLPVTERYPGVRASSPRRRSRALLDRRVPAFGPLLRDERFDLI